MESVQSIGVKLAVPNEKFFERYGSLDDPKSEISRSQLLCLRHAVSEYNFQMNEFTRKNSKVKDLELKHQNHVAFQTRADLIDPPIHESGVI